MNIKRAKRNIEKLRKEQAREERKLRKKIGVGLWNCLWSDVHQVGDDDMCPCGKASLTITTNYGGQYV